MTCELCCYVLFAAYFMECWLVAAYCVQLLKCLYIVWNVDMSMCVMWNVDT